MSKILIIGYGIMTSGIIQNLQKRDDFEIIVFSRHLKELHNISVLCNMEDILQLNDIDIVISCFPEDEELIIFGEKVAESQFIKTGTIFIDMTTARPTRVSRYKKLIEDNSGKFVECPVTGSKSGSMEGTLSLFLHMDFELKNNKLLQEIFKLISSQQYMFENSTEPAKFKLLYNTWGIALLYSISIFNPEYFGFSKQSERTANEIISHDGWMSKVCESKLLQINTEEFEKVAFKLKYSLKDIQYANEEVFCGEANEVNFLVKQLEKINRNNAEKDFTIMGEKINEQNFK